MRKALFISSRELYPIIGGEKIRTAQQLEFLSKDYDVDVICMSESKTYNLGYLREYIHTYYHFYVPKWKNLLWTLRSIFNNKPLQVNYYYSGKIDNFIQRNINKYDIVFCNNIRTTDYFLNRNYSILKCIDYVDAISMNYERTQRISSGIKKLIYTIEAKRCKKYEQLVLNDFNLHCAISNIDANYISPNNIPPIHIINNAVNICDKNKCCKHDIENIITFVGKMSYNPNVVAVTNFANNIFPTIQKKYPKVKFVIVGSDPSEEVKKLAINPNIIVTGFVDDVNQYMVSSTIVIAPMLNGAGVQNKILQAMSLGCCVVTSTIGSEGLGCSSNEINIVDGNKEIANRIIHLLSSSKDRIEYGNKAREYVTNNISKEIIYKLFKNVFAQMQ